MLVHLDFGILQALLSAPESDSIVNTAASQLLHKAPHAYHQMALDCVSASLRVDGQCEDDA